MDEDEQEIFVPATDGEKFGFGLLRGEEPPSNQMQAAKTVSRIFARSSRHPGEWAMAQCASCEDFSTWRSHELIYPRVSIANPPAPDMPRHVQELYEEAREVVGVSRRAGAALARATMEALIKHIDGEAPAKARLDERIQLLIPKVSSSLAGMLTVIRHVGNKTLHVDDVPDAVTVLVLDETQSGIVSLIFQSINDLVDETITRPKAVAAALELVPEGVRSRVEGLNELLAETSEAKSNDFGDTETE